jgi:AcrR family transcriptional regulator
MSQPPSTHSREAILAAAERLFVERGYRGISMREIASEVGVTKAALYYHFRDKEQLFVALLDNVLDELSELIAHCHTANEPVRAQIEAIMRQIMTLPAERRASLRLASQELGNLDAATRQQFVERYHARFIDPIIDILAQGMAQGELRAIDPRTATWALLGMMHPYFHVSSVTGLTPTDMSIQQLSMIFFDGLQA